MMAGYRIAGLDPAPFAPLFGLSDAALAERNIVRMAVTAKPGFPCRVSLEDAEPGESVLLLNHEYQDAPSPYRGRHAIFVREGADTARRFDNELPPCFTGRLISLRAFDGDGMMTDADVISGNLMEPVIERMFADPRVVYLHAHNAKRGCFAARIDRT